MNGSFSWITDDTVTEEFWPSDEGWPYPDLDTEEYVCEEPADPDSETDDDLVSLHAAAPHLFDELSPLERSVITARFGLDGHAPLTMREIQHQLGLPRPELRTALGDGLAKLRARVS